MGVLAEHPFTAKSQPLEDRPATELHCQHLDDDFGDAQTASSLENRLGHLGTQARTPKFFADHQLNAFGLATGGCGRGGTNAEAGAF